MRFFVESWSPEFGAPYAVESEEEAPASTVDLEVEMPGSKWTAVRPAGAAAAIVLFVDGVRRLDARLWVVAAPDESRMGICSSYAAGIVRCDGAASVIDAEVARVAVAPAGLGDVDCGAAVYAAAAAAETSFEGLLARVQQRLRDLEVKLASRAAGADLVVLDGAIRQREAVAGAIGYIKSHHATYLPAEQGALVGRLVAGERTPVFLLDTSLGASAWGRYSWYLKLPGGAGHPWAGVVRCEASPSLAPADAVRLADLVSTTLPRFASSQYKDPRAPQNLSPVAGLERELRRRLGDQQYLLRALQRASLS